MLLPTDLSAAFPHGGTPLGVTRDQELRVGARYHEEIAQEWSAVNRVLYCGSRGVFAAVLRSYDSDAFALLYPEQATGAVSQTSGPAPDVNDDAKRAGRFLTGAVILFSPVALETQPAVLLYNALPMLDESAKLQVSLKVEMATAFMWALAPDSAGRTYAVNKIADLSL